MKTHDDKKVHYYTTCTGMSGFTTLMTMFIFIAPYISELSQTALFQVGGVCDGLRNFS